jgi:CheY-like chemotaxis protein
MTNGHAVPLSSTAEHAGPGARLALGTLLLVDDDTLVRELLGEGLRHQGYRVFEAEDGATALAWLAGGQDVDLMITDFSMPEMTGLDLISYVSATRPALPIFLLTGFADEQVAQNLAMLTQGKGVLLNKPIRVKELAARIAARLAG